MVCLLPCGSQRHTRTQAPIHAQHATEKKSKLTRNVLQCVCARGCASTMSHSLTHTSVIWHMKRGERACGRSMVCGECVSKRALYTIAPIYKRIGRMKRQKNMPERARGDWTHHTFTDRSPRRHQQPRKNLSSDKTHYYLVEANDFEERPNVGEDRCDWWRSHVATNINICSEITMQSVCMRTPFLLNVCTKFGQQAFDTDGCRSKRIRIGVRCTHFHLIFILCFDTLQSTIYILRFTLTVYVQCIPTLVRCAIVHVFAWMLNSLGILIFLSRIVRHSCDPKLLPIRRFRCSLTRNTFLKIPIYFSLSKYEVCKANNLRMYYFPFSIKTADHLWDKNCQLLNAVYSIFSTITTRIESIGFYLDYLNQSQQNRWLMYWERANAVLIECIFGRKHTERMWFKLHCTVVYLLLASHYRLHHFSQCNCSGAWPI